MKLIRKFVIAVITGMIFILCLTSCSDEESGFFITTNRYTQVAPKIFTAVDEPECYDFFNGYKNPSNPMILNDDYVWYYYWEGDTAVLPCLARLDIYANEAEILCKDAQCMHNTPDYKTRCILYDVVGSPLEIQDEKYLYFARADKLVYSDRQDEVKYIDEGTSYEDEIDFEYTYDIIRYELGSGEYKKLWTSDKGEAISNLVLHKGKLYFLTSRFIRKTNEIFQTSDEEYVEFLRITMFERVIVKYPSIFFYEMEHVELQKYEDGFYIYYNSRSDEVYRYPESYFSNGIPEYRIINDMFAYKSYEMHRYDVSSSVIRQFDDKNSSSVNLSENSSSFSIIEDRIYLMSGGRFVSYDLDMTPESREIMLDCRDSESEFFNMTIDDIQYDTFTDNIYMRAKHPNDVGYSIVKMKTAGKNRENKYIRLVDLMKGNIEDYQLTLEGVYFTAIGNEYEGSIYLAKYIHLNFSNVPFETVVQGSETKTEKLCCPTVIGNSIFAYSKKSVNSGKTDFYGAPAKVMLPVDLYRIDLENKSKVQIVPINLKYV